MIQNMHVEMPSPEAWDRHCKAGEQAIRRAIGKAALREVKAGQSQVGHLGTAVGGLVAIGELLRLIGKGADLRVMEIMASAYLRGAIRGLDHPANADGSLYTGAPLDG